MRPSSFPTGWSPPARSMIDRRRAASPTLPSTNAPELSGPRWMSVSFMAARTSGSTAAPSSDTRPQMPHMRLSVDIEGYAPKVSCFAGARDATPGESARAAHRAGQDAPRGRRADAQVEVDRAVRDVLEVVGELLRPGGLAGHPQLGEAGQARLDHQPLPVLRDLAAQLLEERGPDRPRPDDAHVPAHDVPKLRQLVQVGKAQHAPEAGDLRLRALRELVAEVRARAAPPRPE